MTKTTIIKFGVIFTPIGQGKLNAMAKSVAIPVFASFKWVDGKVTVSSWIYDPTIEMREMKKAGLLK
jgi:hypothetical protein